MDSRLFLQDTSGSDLLALGTVAVVGKILCKTNNVNCAKGSNRARKAFKKTQSAKEMSISTSSQAMVASLPPAKGNGAVVVGTKPAVVTTTPTTSGTSALGGKLSAEQLAILQKAQNAKSEQELMQLFQSNPGQALLLMMLKDPNLLKTGVGLVGGLAQALPKIIQSAPQLITGLTSTIGEVLQTVPNLLTGITGAVGDLGGGIFDALSNLWPSSTPSSSQGSSSSSSSGSNGASSGSNGGWFSDFLVNEPSGSGNSGGVYESFLQPIFGETIFGFND